ncbi:MAG: hypothetical protein H6Q19_552 [Bacteroidetes bacterium]|nr:hypothetical protein [Bacteroidota bacterium]
MTLGVLILSFIVFRSILKEMTEEVKNQYKVYQEASAPSYKSNEFVMRVAANKAGSSAVIRHRPANRYVNRQSEGNVHVPIKSADKAISSGFSIPDSDNIIYSRKSKKSLDENSLNFRSMAVISSWSTKPLGTMNLVTSGKDLQSELLASNISVPFSGSNNPGPMRMDGGDDNPPPEGAPVGNGIFVMLLLAAGYTLYRKKFYAE